MKQVIKDFIEKHINLIENNMWNLFFAMSEKEFIPQTTQNIANILSEAGIDVLPYMSYIPEGYYMLSPMTSYTTPDNINSIHYKAFYSSDIATLHITKNCTELSESAFQDCDDLKEVVIDEGLTKLHEYVFYSCSELSQITLPKSLVSFSYNVFMDCDKLIEINYNGTKKDWENIIRHDAIIEGTCIKNIICSDGVIHV